MRVWGWVWPALGAAVIGVMSWAVLSGNDGVFPTVYWAVFGLVVLLVLWRVVRAALRQLGKNSVTIPGWHNRMLVGLLKLTPRRLHTLFAGRVMGKLIAR